MLVFVGLALRQLVIEIDLLKLGLVLILILTGAIPFFYYLLILLAIFVLCFSIYVLVASICRLISDKVHA